LSTFGCFSLAPARSPSRAAPQLRAALAAADTWGEDTWGVVVRDLSRAAWEPVMAARLANGDTSFAPEEWRVGRRPMSCMRASRSPCLAVVRRAGPSTGRWAGGPCWLLARQTVAVLAACQADRPLLAQLCAWQGCALARPRRRVGGVVSVAAAQGSRLRLVAQAWWATESGRHAAADTAAEQDLHGNDEDEAEQRGRGEADGGGHGAGASARGEGGRARGRAEAELGGGGDAAQDGGGAADGMSEEALVWAEQVHAFLCREEDNERPGATLKVLVRWVRLGADSRGGRGCGGGACGSEAG
jgi:hypothetical protein